MAKGAFKVAMKNTCDLITDWALKVYGKFIGN